MFAVTSILKINSHNPHLCLTHTLSHSLQVPLCPAHGAEADQPAAARHLRPAAPDRRAGQGAAHHTSLCTDHQQQQTYDQHQQQCRKCEMHFAAVRTHLRTEQCAARLLTCSCGNFSQNDQHQNQHLLMICCVIIISILSCFSDSLCFPSHSLTQPNSLAIQTPNVWGTMSYT